MRKSVGLVSRLILNVRQASGGWAMIGTGVNVSVGGSGVGVGEGVCVKVGGSLIVEQSAEDLSKWENESFDSANVLLSLYDMPHPERAVDEMIRVLCPGGLLVITEPKRTFKLQSLIDHVEDYLIRNGLIDELGVDMKRVFEANIKRDPGARGARMRAEDIEQRLEEAGFRDIRVVDSHFGNCSTILGTKPRVL